MGGCKEVTVTITSTNITGYECECYSGWSRPNITFPWPLPPHLFLPCAIPTCLSISDFTCYRPKLPNAANATLDPWSRHTMTRSEGTCVRGDGRQYQCPAQPM